MQATVAAYDVQTGAGYVLADDGSAHDFGADALADHIRHLRSGQRVHIALKDDGTIGALSIFAPQ